MALSELLPVGAGVRALNLRKEEIGIVLSSTELMGGNGSQQDLHSTLVFAYLIYKKRKRKFAKSPPVQILQGPNSLGL